MNLPTWDEYNAVSERRYGRDRRRPSPAPRTAEEFFARAVPQESGCLAWAGPYHVDYYGSVYLNGRTTMAHRAAWMFAHGAIPAGMWVLHRCDNRRCVNPDHLYLGTAADNGVDFAARYAKDGLTKATRVNPWEPSNRLNGGSQ